MIVVHFSIALRLIAVLSFSGGHVHRESALQCRAPRQGAWPKHAVAPPSPNSDMALRHYGHNSGGPEDECGWRAEGQDRSPGREGRCRPTDVEGSPHACATPELPRAAQNKRQHQRRRKRPKALRARAHAATQAPYPTHLCTHPGAVRRFTHARARRTSGFSQEVPPRVTLRHWGLMRTLVLIAMLARPSQQQSATGLDWTDQTD